MQSIGLWFLAYVVLQTILHVRMHMYWQFASFIPVAVVVYGAVGMVFSNLGPIALWFAIKSATGIALIILIVHELPKLIRAIETEKQRIWRAYHDAE